MEKKFVLVTNNPKALIRYQDHPAIGVEYLEGQGFLDVLVRVRDLVHGGFHLMSHPQASNLKPNQCPYKTVLVSCGREAQPFDRDVEMIESAIAAVKKFTKGMEPPVWTEKALRDFETIDLSVVESALNSSILKQMIIGME